MGSWSSTITSSLATYDASPMINLEVCCGGCPGLSFATTHPSRKHSEQGPFEVVYGWPPSSLASYQLGLAQVVPLDKQLMDRDEFLATVPNRLLKSKNIMKQGRDTCHRDLSYDTLHPKSTYTAQLCTWNMPKYT